MALIAGRKHLVLFYAIWWTFHWFWSTMVFAHDDIQRCLLAMMFTSLVVCNASAKTQEAQPLTGFVLPLRELWNSHTTHNTRPGIGPSFCVLTVSKLHTQGTNRKKKKQRESWEKKSKKRACRDAELLGNNTLHYSWQKGTRKEAAGFRKGSLCAASASSSHIGVAIRQDK